MAFPSTGFATSLPPTISENTTLTAAGNPYTGNPTIKAGITLTVKPGVTFTLYNLSVDGTLKVEGTAEEPVIFTGAKEATSGEWCSIDFRAGSGASVIDHALVKHGGGCGGGAIRVDGSSSPTVTNSAFSQNSGYGVLVSEGGAPEIADNVILGSGVSYAAAGTKTGEVNIHGNYVEGGGTGINVAITSSGSVVGKNLGGNTIVKTTTTALHYKGQDIPGNITGNALSGNKSDVITLDEGKVATSSTWNDGGTPVKVEGSVTVASGVTLTITKGVFLTGTPNFSVDGTLKVEGTAEDPVLFTGAKETSAGEWCAITFRSGSGSSVIDYAVVKNGGGCTTGAVAINGGSSPTVKNTTFSKTSGYAIRVPEGGAPEIADNLILGSSGIDYAAAGTKTGEVNIHGNYVEGGANGIIANVTSSGSVVGKDLGGNAVIKTTTTAFSYKGPDIPGNITGNTLVENKQDVIKVDGTIASSSTWNDGGTTVVSEGGVTVASGATLTMTKGLLLEFYNLTVKGTLKAEGVANDPIVFTRASTTWCSIDFSSGSGASLIEYADVSRGGACGGGTIRITSSSPTIKNSTIRNASGYAINVTSGSPKIEHNRFRAVFGGVDYGGSGILAAPNNDWGCASGPKPAGCGVTAGAKVNWKPAAQPQEPDGHCPGKESQCGEDGDPVSLATGHLSYTHRDLLLANKSEAPLEFARSYYSGSAADTGFGLGWSQTGLASATELASGAVLILRQDGRQDLFLKTESGYKAPSGVTSTLARVEGTFQLTTLENTVYRFDTSGRIASITDDHGLKTTYVYNGEGRLSTVTDPSAQMLTFSYNASNHVTLVKDSTGREVKYTYSGAGDLATVTDALGGVTEFTYDSEHRIKTIKDPRGNVILKNTYDGQGRVVEQLDGLENLWKLEYKEGETIVTEPEDGKLTYGFDGQDRIVSEKDQLGAMTTTSYDEAGNVDEIVKPGGAKWQFGHDANGNLTSVIDPEEGERSYEYNGKNKLTGFTDEREETWTYEWSEANDLEKVTDPAEGETTFTYDAAGLPLTITDPNEHTTTFTYDTRGNRLTAKDGLEHATTLVYNTRNHLTSRTAPGLKAETYGRNALGDLLSVTTPEGSKTEYAYDANGMPKQITDPAKEVWKIERNAMERPTAYVDPLGKETKLEYDGNLNVVKVTDRRGKDTTYAYDLANQLTDVVRPESGDWEFDYDVRGNRIKTVEPRENATSYEYDLLDRMTEVVEPLEATTSYEYDPAGNLISFIDPREHTTDLFYDEVSQFTELKQPLGKVTSFGYDGVGNRTSRTTAEGTVAFAYDAVDRLERVSEGETTLRSFGYDNAGRMVGATDAQADEIEIGYDDDNRVVSIDDGRGGAVSRKYDSRGNVIEQVDGRGALSFEYDKLSRMVELTDPQSKVLDFGYDPEGNLTKVELPNGVVATNAFDNAGRLAETTSEKGETALDSLAYEYDPSGNRITQVDRFSQETSYEYDALNRLTAFDPPGEGSTGYGYDPVGNRIEAGAVTYSFNDLNQLTSASNGTIYDYDDAGRLIELDQGETRTTYDWNVLDELVGVNTGAQESDYAYDAFGRLVLRDDGSTVRSAHYGDLSDLPILDTDAEGEPRMSYVQGPGGLVEQRSGGATSFPLRDAHGDITTLADGEGEVASRQSYDPWGDQLSGPSLEMGWLGAQQRRSDSATELIQMGIRPYSSALGGLIAEDPVLGHLGIGMSVDRYLYALSNPLNRYDLNGRDVCVFGGCIGPDDVVSIGEDVEGGLGIAEEGINTVGSTTGSAADDMWGWTAPGREWTSDRAQDFWKAHGDMLEDIYRFTGKHWEGCAKGTPPGALAGGTIGSFFGPAGTGIGGGIGGVAGCGGVVGGEVLYGERLR